MSRARLCFALAALLAGCRAEIERGLPEAQANEVLVALDEHGIHAVKEPERGEGSFAILVSGDDVASALAVLRAEELPRAPDPGLHDLFGTASLVPTATEERARLTAALGGELARTIEAIDGVLDARVHVALPDASELPLDAPPPRPRASVLIRHRGARAPYDDAAIQRLVAGAIQGMDPGDVAVVGVAAPEPATPAGAHLASLGPIAVARGSIGTLKLVLGVLLGTNGVLALLLALAVVRHRRAARTHDAGGTT
ncbi:hypothetical protein [Sandaracinus amylolyticus]|uniref:Type III secretion bridge between inner and outermembrane lipoprotein n=1 Tax=Sandaracinus amylolyticus TaxID=927083 RepID=A0A0F6YKT8_9BACT|nr:hypothetical protein [Sandaracinus amylolyticus]AKF07597.1 Type III secretion bridge between inner and outermembrane lipoprotein [Sandaracinus amylolyticus]